LPYGATLGEKGQKESTQLLVGQVANSLSSVVKCIVLML